MPYGEFHQPRIGDKFWDGQEEPQPNGKIIQVNWRDEQRYDDKTVVVEFYDSYHRRTYTFGEIKDNYDRKYKLYLVNKVDFAGGFALTNGEDWNDPLVRQKYGLT